MISRSSVRWKAFPSLNGDERKEYCDLRDDDVYYQPTDLADLDAIAS